VAALQGQFIRGQKRESLLFAWIGIAPQDGPRPIQQRPGFREENLRGSILNPNPKPTDPGAKKTDDKTSQTKPDANKGDNKTTAATPASTDPDEPPKDAVADYQLMRAVDLIRGISLYSSRGN